jgi:hypothetical protein
LQLLRGFIDRNGLGRFAGIALLRTRSLEPGHRRYEQDDEENERLK